MGKVVMRPDVIVMVLIYCIIGILLGTAVWGIFQNFIGG